MTRFTLRFARLLLGIVSLATLSNTALAGKLPASPLTVVELFQSQGCSSCPPAVANLNALAGRPDILALSFGVTYWDDLGWKDTFAASAYTDRQYDYAHYSHRSGVFTPQVIVDGQTSLVGSDAGELNRVIEKARLYGPAMTWGSGTLQVGAARTASPADVWLVRYDPRTLDVAISAGENRGRTLAHRNVVRALVHLGRWDGSAQTFRLPAPARDGLSTAALVQLPSGGKILGASEDASDATSTASR